MGALGCEDAGSRGIVYVSWMLMRGYRAQGRWYWRCEESFGEEACCETWYGFLRHDCGVVMLILV
jgi:predicted MarR family transcription regulator